MTILLSELYNCPATHPRVSLSTQFIDISLYASTELKILNSLHFLLVFEWRPESLPVLPHIYLAYCMQNLCWLTELSLCSTLHLYGKPRPLMYRAGVTCCKCHKYRINILLLRSQDLWSLWFCHTLQMLRKPRVMVAKGNGHGHGNSLIFETWKWAWGWKPENEDGAGE